MDRLDGLKMMLEEALKYDGMTGKEGHNRGWSQWKWKKWMNSPQNKGMN